MRRIMVAGNWKMHGTPESVADLVTQIKQGVAAHPDVDFLVSPAYVFLPSVAEALRDTGVALSAQDISAHDEGAFTGEVSASMAKDCGATHTLVGHSERRQLHAESNKLVAQKFFQAKQQGLVPILCVGETLEQREQGQTDEVVLAQIQAVLDAGDASDALENSIIAYEPVWAIGTGVNASPEQAQAVHHSIRVFIAEHNRDLADRIQILYGGSVKPENATGLFAQRDIDGGLIGGASLNAQAFLLECLPDTKDRN